jgi:hypothetical protein
LWPECRGRAKLTSSPGFISIDDAIQQKGRVGEGTWEAEMLCERPTRSATVYPRFNPTLHAFDDSSPQHSAPTPENSRWIGGIDFGYRSPTVLLWAFVDQENIVRVLDELVLTEHTTDQIIAKAAEKCAQPHLRRPEWIGADPAGHHRSEHTGRSTISLWKKAGWPVRTRRVLLEAGIEAVARRLKCADGSVGLRIHQRCAKLIEALTMYHYDPSQPESMTPEKDGHDHAADALRYMVVNLDRDLWEVERREY